jgi:hypothetical protein
VWHWLARFERKLQCRYAFTPSWLKSASGVLRAVRGRLLSNAFRLNEVGNESHCDRTEPETDAVGDLAVHGSINGHSGERDSEGVEHKVVHFLFPVFPQSPLLLLSNRAGRLEIEGTILIAMCWMSDLTDEALPLASVYRGPPRRTLGQHHPSPPHARSPRVLYYRFRTAISFAGSCLNCAAAASMAARSLAASTAPRSLAGTGCAK